jgi:myo-inositol-1(or 4)-monophosphatase
MNSYLETAVNSARLAGDLIIANLGKLSKSDVSIKQASDYVTRIDRSSEEIIINMIRKNFPNHIIHAEESGKDTVTGEYRWIIDPLDGTTNYIHGYPQFSISIGLEHKGEVILGVILDPLRDELFTAIKGRGTLLNGKPVRISSIPTMRESLLSTGFPFRNKEMIGPYLDLFRALFNRISDMRRAGSAALDLAYVAAGRCDGFFEIGLSPWDIAAGSIMIKEAGGIISDFSGSSDYLITGNVVAGNPHLHPMILKAVREIFNGIIDR